MTSLVTKTSCIIGWRRVNPHDDTNPTFVDTNTHDVLLNDPTKTGLSVAAAAVGRVLQCGPRSVFEVREVIRLFDFVWNHKLMHSPPKQERAWPLITHTPIQPHNAKL